MATLLTFSDLPDTVILDIMEYLSPIDVYRAMHGINNRLDNIIRYGTTRINLSNIESKQGFDYHMEHILPDVTTSLRFLKAANDFLFDQEQGRSDSRQRPVMFGIIKKVQAKLKLATYEKLEELSLKNVNGTQLKLISDEIGNMFQLKRLTISFYGTTADFCASLLSNAVIRSKLTTLDLFLTDANASFPNIPSTHILLNLDHLTVNACIIGNAAVLCRMVPNIKYLSICIWNFPNQRPTNLTETFILPNLTYLKLKLDEVRWNFAENFLKQCGQNVKHLTFKASDDFVFIDATKWENLMTNHMKQLIKFHFHISLWDSSINDIDLKPFNSEFWSQLNVHVACDWMKGSFEEDGDIIDVYTVPFCLSSFRTGISSINIVSPSINRPYERIKGLSILMNEEPIRDTKRFYKNADSITLTCIMWHSNNVLSFLNMSVNCDTIRHIGFSSVCAVLKPQVFYHLLQLCPNLYSMRVHATILNDMTTKFTDNQTCLLLNKMIKHIEFNTNPNEDDFDEQTMKRFVPTYGSLERILIHMKSPDNILRQLTIMINSMQVLNKIFIQAVNNLPHGFIDQLKEAIPDLKESYIRKEKSCLFIWR